MIVCGGALMMMIGRGGGEGPQLAAGLTGIALCCFVCFILLIMVAGAIAQLVFIVFLVAKKDV